MVSKYSFQASFKPMESFPHVYESFHHMYVLYSFLTALSQSLEDNKLAN